MYPSFVKQPYICMNIIGYNRTCVHHAALNLRATNLTKCHFDKSKIRFVISFIYIMVKCFL